MNEDEMPSELKEVIDKSIVLGEQAEIITDNLCLTSTLIIGVVPFGRKGRGKIVGYDGSLYELAEACREFLADFESGAYSSAGMVEFQDGEDESEN